MNALHAYDGPLTTHGPRRGRSWPARANGDHISNAAPERTTDGHFPHDKQQPDPDRDELGPVDFLAIEFPDAGKAAPGFERLLSLAHQGVVAILDLEFIAKDSAGNARKVDLDQLELDGLDGLDLSAWSAASSGLLDDSDVGEIAEAIAPGSAAAVIVCENRWVLGLLNTWRRNGARLIAESGIPASEVAAAFDPAGPC